MLHLFVRCFKTSFRFGRRVQRALGIGISEEQMVHSRLDSSRAYCAGISRVLPKEEELLGNKASLERHIREITGIPVKALRGGSLPDFSVTERML